MRIISGIYKGRRIQSIEGKNTRPTTNRVREAWASSITSILSEGGLQDLRVLDVFAGSGALGLELLSRGAGFCQFLENDKKSLAVLRENIAQLGLSDTQAKSCHLDSLSSQLSDFLKDEPAFDLVILDPPYKLTAERMSKLLITLAQAKLLKEHSLISYEHARTAKESLGGITLVDTPHTLVLNLVRAKKYGTIHLDFYLCCTPDEEEE